MAELVINVNENFEVTCKRLENKLNYLIGFNYWKRYTASAFWNNISTPFNLLITLLTAIMAAHTTSNGFISDDMNIKISIISLFITTLNTFFRPHMHATDNLKCITRWLEFGFTFESIYYSHSFSYQQKVTNYNNLLKDIYAYKTQEASTQQNFITDLIHVFVQQCCLYNLVCDGKGEEWLANDLNRPRPKYCCVSNCCPSTNSSKVEKPLQASIELTGPTIHMDTLYDTNSDLKI